MPDFAKMPHHDPTSLLDGTDLTRTRTCTIKVIIMTPLPIIKLVVIFIKTLGRITRPARWARFTTIITAIHIE
jgi:hypothetical protein